MVNKKSVTFEEVLEEVKKYIHKPENIDLITRAYLFARDQHEGQFRKSGEPYIIHAIQVGSIRWHCLRTGPKTVAAGFLHDTVEDCEAETEDIARLFGDDESPRWWSRSQRSAR